MKITDPNHPRNWDAKRRADVFRLEKMLELPSGETPQCVLCDDPIGDSKHRCYRGPICNACFQSLRGKK